MRSVFQYGRCLVLLVAGIPGLVSGCEDESPEAPSGGLGAATGGIITGGVGGPAPTGGVASPTGGATGSGGGVSVATGGAAATGGVVMSGGMDSGGGATATGGMGADSGVAMSGGMDGGTMPGSSGNSCGLPAVTDYGARGPFDDVQMFPAVGPAAGYTLFRPTASLGRDGAKHPIAVWGNGILTSPDMYQGLLTHVASHGIVVLACNSPMAERPCLNDGLDWLVSQNESGEMAGKLDVERELTIGYSWGGGASIDTADRPNIKATASLHGMPPRGATAFADMHAPLLLFTTTGDSFVNAQQYVTPNYNSSQVTTFYATLDALPGHLYPLDPGTLGCDAGGLFTGEPPENLICEGAKQEQAPLVAWLRLWACDDDAAKAFFYGPDCTLCSGPWSSQTKPPGAFDD